MNEKSRKLENYEPPGSLNVLYERERERAETYIGSMQQAGCRNEKGNLHFFN